VAKLAKKNIVVRTIVKKLRIIYTKTRYYFGYYIKYSTQDNIVLFASFKGEKYCDSPKAIYEEMVNNPKYSNYTFVWALKKSVAEKDGERTPCHLR